LQLRTGSSLIEQTTAAMQIQLKDDGKKGAFYIQNDGKVVAEMAFVWVGEQKLIIDHTDVDPSLKGKGAGKQLVHRAVEFVKEKNIKIIPLCPFAKSVFDKTPEYADVLS
jgi:predicted GNAT family acetyltransferase